MTKQRLRGRPLKFKTRQELIDAIQKYLKDTKQEELTVTGLCLAIGTSRVVLDDYQKRDKYKDIVTEAKLIIENSYELSLRRRGRSGDIFALKNFGWTDRSESDIKISGGLSLTNLYDAAKETD